MPSASSILDIQNYEMTELFYFILKLIACVIRKDKELSNPE